MGFEAWAMASQRAASPGTAAADGSTRSTSTLPPLDLLPDEPGRDDAAVVEHEEIAGREQVGQVVEAQVPRRASGAGEDEQARRAPRLHRRLGDEFLGEREVELGDLHPPSDQYIRVSSAPG